MCFNRKANGYFYSVREIMSYKNIHSTKWIKEKIKAVDTIYAEVLSDSRIKEALNAINDYHAETYVHGLRVGKIIAKLGIYENRKKEQLKEMIMAGLLLDIGYIRIPKKYITKSDRLVASEFHEIKNHPKYGAQLAKEIGMSVTVQQYIYDHHERPDGTGYPRRKNDYDFMEGQLEINITDTIMAMQEPRAYRRAINENDAYNRMYNMATSRDELEILDRIKMIQKLFAITS